MLDVLGKCLIYRVGIAHLLNSRYTASTQLLQYRADFCANRNLRLFVFSDASSKRGRTGVVPAYAERLDKAIGTEAGRHLLDWS